MKHNTLFFYTEMLQPDGPMDVHTYIPKREQCFKWQLTEQACVRAGRRARVYVCVRVDRYGTVQVYMPFVHSAHHNCLRCCWWS